MKKLLLVILLILPMAITMQAQSIGTGTGYHSIVTKANGTVYTWGRNSEGQLGNNSTTNSNVPVAVDASGVLSGKTITQVALGTYFSLALDNNGMVYAWGQNNYGQLGNNSTTNSNVPVAVDTSGVLSGKAITQISGGLLHSMALDNTGIVYTWGYSGSGQLGNGTWGNGSTVPVEVDRSGVLSGKTIIQIAAGGYHCVAVASDGTVYTWGGNTWGQLGNNSTTDSNVPVAVDMSGALSGKTITQVAAGEGFSVALASDGTVYTWGLNDYGQLGNGNTGTNSSVPVAVDMNGVLSGKTITQVAAGRWHAIALASDGTVYSWGANMFGQLGNNSTTDSNIPVAVYADDALNGVSIVKVAAGNTHSFALGDDNKVYTWGQNNYGQLGYGVSYSYIRVPVAANIYLGSYSGGSGTSGDPYQIATTADMIELSKTQADWDKYFIQTADITFNPDETQVDWDGDGSATWDTEDQLGFSPIGTDLANNFSGEYDGQNYGIYNLYINRSSDTYVGMFGNIQGASAANEKIRNINLYGVDITGQYYVGGVAGYVGFAKLNNCYSDGNISATDGQVGGIVGGCWEIEIDNSSSASNLAGNTNGIGGIAGISYNAVFYRNYFEGSFNANSCDNVGGIVGAADLGQINQCYSDVNIQGNNNIGGVVGSIRGIATLTDCYSGANVQGNQNVGGLVGYAGVYSSNYPTITNSYSHGPVSGSSSVGGLIGAIETGTTVTNSFWDTETSRQLTSAGGEGKTTAEMKDHTTFTAAGWDFVLESANGNADIWDMDYSGTINDGYPYLNWQDGGDISLPVNLSLFTAIAGDGKVVLQWVTESELNNDAFLLERSTDGESYELIAEIEGQGTKSERTEYRFTDNYVINGQTYHYRLGDRDFSGRITWHNSITVTPMEAGVEKVSEGLIKEYALYPAYPNPFNPETTIRFSIPNVDQTLKTVRIAVFDVMGRYVTTLYNGSMVGGSFEVKWNGKNETGQQVSTGLYFIQLRTENYVNSQKVLLMK